MAGKVSKNDKDRRLDISGKGDVDISGSSNFDSKDLKITDLSGEGVKKTGTNKVEIDTGNQLQVPFEQSGAADAALLAATAAIGAQAIADNNDEVTTSEKVPKNKPPKENIPTDKIAEPTANKQVNKPESVAAEKTELAKNTTPETPQPKQITTANQPTKNLSISREAEPQPTSESKTPPTLNKNEQSQIENRPKKKIKQTTPEPTTQPTNARIPISDENLSNVGPHIPEQNTIPPTLDTAAQTPVGNQLAQNQAQNRNLGQRVLDNVGQKAVNLKEGVKNAPKKFQENIKQGLETRKNTLRRQRDTLEKELQKLEGDISGLKSSLAMRIVKFWFPPIYAAIKDITSGPKNVQGQAKILALQAVLLKAQTTKAALTVAKGVTSAIDAFVLTIETSAALCATGFGVVLFILSGCGIFIFIGEFIFVLGTGKGSLTFAVHEIIKEVDSIIKQTRAVLEPEKKKIQTRRKVQSLNHAIADETKNAPKAANDNTEQQQEQNLPKAA